jgi:NADPH2:quinone reductase
VKPGDFVLVLAGAGGLGQILLRWGRKLGATMIATAGSAAKAEIARAAGAHHVLLHSDPDWPAQARALSQGLGVMLACDGIGGDMLERSMEVVRPFGILASLGQPAGPIPPIRVEQLGPSRSISLARPSVMNYSTDPVRYRRGAAELLDFLSDEPLPAPTVYPLRDAAQAHADLETGRTTGSIVLVP